MFEGYKWECSASLVDFVDLGFDSELHNIIESVFELSRMGFIVPLSNGCCSKQLGLENRQFQFMWDGSLVASSAQLNSLLAEGRNAVVWLLGNFVGVLDGSGGDIGQLGGAGTSMGVSVRLLKGGASKSIK